MRKKTTMRVHRLGLGDPLPLPAAMGQPLPLHGFGTQDRCLGPQTCHLEVQSAAGANLDLLLHPPLLPLMGQQRVEPKRRAQRALGEPRLAQQPLEPPR